MSLENCRKEFELTSNRAVSMPIAGAVVWAFIAFISTQFDTITSTYILIFATGAIFPIGLLVAKLRNEDLVSSKNPLAKLMGICVLMVNLLWGLHIPLLLNAPEFIPLSLGIGLGLHWVVYSWIIQHPLGLIHAISRAVLLCAVWFLFPEKQLLIMSCVIVGLYIITIYQMLTRNVVST